MTRCKNARHPTRRFCWYVADQAVTTKNLHRVFVPLVRRFARERQPFVLRESAEVVQPLVVCDTCNEDSDDREESCFFFHI